MKSKENRTESLGETVISFQIRGKKKKKIVVNSENIKLCFLYF